MPTSIERGLLDRLVVAKYIFLRGVEELGGASELAAGLALLHFQDSAEMVLRIIAEHLGVSMKPTVAFNQIIDSIDEKATELGRDPVPRRSALNQLNNARVSFKHYGNRPNSSDVQKFRDDLETFFATACREYLDLSFETVSLADLITYRRAANWLHKAETYSNNGMYPEACACSAIGLKLYRRWRRDRPWRDYRHTDKLETKLRSQKYRRPGKWDIPESVGLLAKELDSRVGEIWDRLDILFDGIDALSYRRFLRHTPEVLIPMAGTILGLFEENGELRKVFVNDLPPATPEIAAFCYRFALDTMFQMQRQPISPQYEPYPFDIKYVVASKTDVVVHPEGIEVIRQAEEGETLHSYAHFAKGSTDTHVAIFEQGEVAYVLKDHLEQSSPLPGQ